MILLVTHNSNNSRNSDAFKEKIESLGEAKRDSDFSSLWFLKSDQSASEVYRQLKPYIIISSSDRLFVSPVTSDYMSYIDEDLGDWITANL